MHAHMGNPGRIAQSGTSFALGANLPWIHYGGDFGANAWRPEGGIATTGIPDEIRRRVGQLRDRGADIVRWFLFCDGRAGIRFRADGAPAGLDEHVLPDMDAAVTFASDSGTRIVFTLFDFPLARPAAIVNGVRTGGRRTLVSDAAHRAALLERVVTPVLDRFRDHPAIYAWDVINEPEWMTLGLGAWRPWRAVTRRTMAAFLAEMTALIHAKASQAVTVGLASARWLSLVRHAGLDFYQVHWYDHIDRLWPLDRAVASLRLDKPVILGEFPTRGSRHDPATILSLARDAGYAGAWLWSANASDEATALGAGIAGLTVGNPSR